MYLFLAVLDCRCRDFSLKTNFFFNLNSHILFREDPRIVGGGGELSKWLLLYCVFSIIALYKFARMINK